MKKIAAIVVTSGLVLTGCSNSSKDDTSAKESVSITNCGEIKELHKPDTLWAHDGNIASIALAAGAREKLKYVSSIQNDADVMNEKYGNIKDLNEVNEKQPSLEEIVAKHPDMYFAGWNYGMNDTTKVNPDSLAEHGIEAYVLTESCKQTNGKRGTVNPWEAVDIDLKNIGELAGSPAEAKSVIEDIHSRRDKLEQAPKSDKKPTVFLFDSAKDTIFTSGKFGGPQAIFDAVGVKNATEDVDDTWTTVSWEKLATENPDAIAFVDYPGQSFDEKVAILKSHPATKDLKAVKEDRFINLPYATWTSGPLNIDAAEHVRAALEHFGQLPKSDIKPELDMPDSLAGQNYVK